MPLKSSGGSLVQITNSGSVKTLRAATDNGNYNANFYILIPAYTPPASMPLTVAGSGVGAWAFHLPRRQAIIIRLNTQPI